MTSSPALGWFVPFLMLGFVLVSSMWAVAGALVSGYLLPVPGLPSANPPGIAEALWAIPGAATIQIAMKEYLEYSRRKRLPASPAA